MSDKYYCGIRNSIDDTKYKLQLASMTLRINKNKNNINGIKSDISGINDFSVRTNTNKNNNSFNLGKISNNETKISFNLNQMNDIKAILPTLEIF